MTEQRPNATMHVLTLTIARARASALTQAHDCTCIRSRLRARLAPDSQANLANSCMCFIGKPLRTPEMAKMAKMAKVLVVGQHSHFLLLKSMLFLISPPCQDIGAAALQHIVQASIPIEMYTICTSHTSRKSHLSV